MIIFAHNLFCYSWSNKIEYIVVLAEFLTHKFFTLGQKCPLLFIFICEGAQKNLQFIANHLSFIGILLAIALHTQHPNLKLSHAPDDLHPPGTGTWRVNCLCLNNKQLNTSACIIMHWCIITHPPVSTFGLSFFAIKKQQKQNPALRPEWHLQKISQENNNNINVEDKMIK